MKKSILLFFITCFLSFEVIAQNYIQEGTLSRRDGNKYHPMAGFTTTDFEEYHWTKNNPNPFSGNLPMNFRLMKPRNYDANKEEGYPLIMMLHGVGENGARVSPSDARYLNNDHQLLHGAKMHRDVIFGQDPERYGNREFNGFLFYPQNTNKNSGWTYVVSNGTGEVPKAIEILEELIRTYNINPNKIYIHGLSNGAGGVWKAVENRPELFAAFLPMSGPLSGFTHAKANHIVSIPMWLFQKEKDPQTSTLTAQGNYNRLKEVGGNPRYMEFAGDGHDSWSEAYKQPDFFSWMLEQDKRNILIYHGDSMFCAETTVDAKLGISPGFQQYIWKKDGEIIGQGANLNTIIVDDFGSYTVDFQRKDGSWEKSFPAKITVKPPTPRPTILALGSTVMPTNIDGKTSVTLTTTLEYESYLWSNGETTRTIEVSSPGSYSVIVTEEKGCSSSSSKPLYIITEDVAEPEISAPSDFSIEIVSSGRVNLFWRDNADDELGYEIYRSNSENGPFTYITSTSPNAVFYSDSTLEGGTTYYYTIRAYNNIGSSDYTSVVAVTTPEDIEPPSAPKNLIASGNLDNESISLSWEASSDNVSVAGYDIYTVDSDGSLVFLLSVSDNSYVHQNLDPNQIYTYAVIARDGAGNSSTVSNYATSSPILCGLAFKFYRGPTYNSVDEITPASYIEGQGIASNFNIGIRGDFTSFNDYFAFEFDGYINIQQGGTYTFYLKSNDGSKLWINDMDNNNELIDNDGRKNSGQIVERTSSVTLSSGLNRIKVKYFEAVNPDEFLEVSYMGPDTGGKKIRIPDEVLCNNKISQTTPLSAPISLEAETLSTTQILLEWIGTDPDATGYEIYRANSFDGPFEMVASAGKVEQYIDENLEANTTYWYRLRAISPIGNSNFTDQTRLRYKYYEGEWNAIPNYNNLSTIQSGYATNIGLEKALQDDYFSFVFEGSLKIDVAGNYTFRIGSDDGSKMYLYDTLLIDNDGLHGVVWASKTVTLPAGLHPIKVEYFEKTGGANLYVHYSGPGFSDRLIPNNAFNTTVVKATTFSDGEPPSIPTDLVIKSVGATTVGLSWSPSTDNVAVVGYEIYDETADTLLARTNANGIIITDDDGTVNSLAAPVSKGFKKAVTSAKHNSILSETEEPPLKISTLIEGLTPTTGYYIYVKAIDASNNKSDKSNTVGFTTGSEQPLPIELLDFYAEAKNSFIEIKWITASEKNNDFFTIERSLDGKQFRPIGEVDGKGNSVETTYYTYEDHNPFNGVQYYQLKQTDFDGAFEYSKIIRVNYQEKMSQFEVTVFPNPVTTSYEFAVQINSSNKESSVSISIFDMLGREHYRSVVDAESALNEIKISKASLSAGIYIVSVQQADKITKKRIVVE